MSEASRRGRVTITLGRSGQVVKRAVSEFDADSNSNQLPSSGSKRSVRDRLGSQLDSSSLYGSEVINKRQRGEANFSANDLQISKGDLRLKLMRKNARRQAQRDEESTVDLRVKLSRTQRPPHSADAQPRMAEPRDASVFGPMPPFRTAHNFSQVGTTSSSYSPWTLDHIRRRSPNRFVGTSRGLSPTRNAGSFIGSSRCLSPPRNAGSFIGTSRVLSPTRNAGGSVGLSRGFSPPRNVGDLHGRPLSRALDEDRVSSYAGKHALNALPLPRSAPYTTGMTLPAPTPKLPPPMPSLPSLLPPPGKAVQNIPFTVDEHQTVDGFLNSLGLSKYAITLKAEEVDMPALKQMRENDLKDLGIPMGPRKKILQALTPHSKRQP